MIENLNIVITRIQRMELYFDTIEMALGRTPYLLKEDSYLCGMVNSLIEYYESDLWKSDFELDEQGMLPSNLKRGILSEDGIYNLITEIDKFM